MVEHSRKNKWGRRRETKLLTKAACAFSLRLHKFLLWSLISLWLFWIILPVYYAQCCLQNILYFTHFSYESIYLWITGATLTVALNLALDPSCMCTSLEDASSFDSCLLRSERERERKRDPTLLNTRLASSGSQTSFSNSSFTPLPKTCFLLSLSSLPLIRPSAYLEVNSAAWKREKVFFVCLTSNPRPFEKANREKLPLLWAWRDLQTTAFSATLLAL